MNAQTTIRLGTIKHRDGYEVALFQKGDKYLRQESIPFRVDPEEGYPIWARSQFDEISYDSLYGYCREYFGKAPELCWCEFWTTYSKR